MRDSSKNPSDIALLTRQFFVCLQSVLGPGAFYV